MRQRVQNALVYVSIISLSVWNGIAGFMVPPFLDHVGYSVSWIGILVALSPLMSLASRVPAGAFYRPDRARAMMFASMAALAVSTYLYGVVTDLWGFVVVIAATGFTYGVATTVNLASFIDSLEVGRDRHNAMGYYSGCLATGFSIGNTLGGFLAELFGYQMAFAITASFPLLAIIALKPSRLGAPSRPGSDSQGAAKAKTQGLPLLSVLLMPEVLAIILVAFLLNFIHQIYSAFFPLLGLGLGLTLAQIGVLRGAYALANAVMRTLTGPLTKRFGRRLVPPIGMALQAATLAVMPSFAGFVPLLLVLLASGTFRAVVLVTNTISLAQDVDENKVSRGVATGLFSAASDVGSILGPFASGLVASAVGVQNMYRLLPPAAAGLYVVLAALLLKGWGRQSSRKRDRPTETSTHQV